MGLNKSIKPVSRACLSSGEGLEDDCGVVTAKAKIIADGDLDRSLDGLVGHVFQITLRIRIFVIHGGRNNPGANSLNTRDRLNPPSRS